MSDDLKGSTNKSFSLQFKPPSYTHKLLIFLVFFLHQGTQKLVKMPTRFDLFFLPAAGKWRGPFSSRWKENRWPPKPPKSN